MRGRAYEASFNPPFMKTTAVRRALISVADKRGVESLGRELARLNIAIISTGGTARKLRAAGLTVEEVSDYTGFPEIMDGRVKTLHPKIHAGILARRERDAEIMRDHHIAAIDLVAVNLYPFAQTVAARDCDLPRAIENIDIGGPAMLRAAAKNHAAVAVLTAPDDYDEFIAHLRQHHGRVTADFRLALAAKAFAHSAQYDAAIADYFATANQAHAGVAEPPPASTPKSAAPVAGAFPSILRLQFHKKQDLRYGENPHQAAAFYTEPDAPAGGLARARQLQGKELSFNNIHDADAAYACVLECARQFPDSQACVIVKHANPCGAALAAKQTEAYLRAFAADAESAFGGVLAFSQPLQKSAADAVIARQFAEVIIAPAVSAAAAETLARKPNIRILTTGPLAEVAPRLDYKRVDGGLLAQHTDASFAEKLTVVTKRAPTAAQMESLRFAWAVAKFVKSNAIVYARGENSADIATIGIGAGQMSRVNSARLAAMKAAQAGLKTTGAVLASDAFFPFRDGLDMAAADGIAAIIQPGGARRDAEIIAAAEEHRMAMVFTGMRHFRH